MRYLALALILLATPVKAEPVDDELFDMMVRAVAEIPMPLSAHQKALEIFANVRKEAAAREAKRRMEDAKRKQAPSTNDGGSGPR